MHLIIGTYTEQLPHVHGKADGILAASFDPASGRIGPVTSLAAARNPSYLAASASGENIYAVHETAHLQGPAGRRHHRVRPGPAHRAPDPAQRACHARGSRPATSPSTAAAASC